MQCDVRALNALTISDRRKDAFFKILSLPALFYSYYADNIKLHGRFFIVFSHIVRLGGDHELFMYSTSIVIK
jgi:hypothetical protein